jgi:hypothetical protein
MRGIQDIHRALLAAALAVGCTSSPTEPTLGERTGLGTPEPVLHLVVTPAVATVRPGETLKLSAIAASQDRGVVRRIAVTWLSSDTDIASVSSTGLLLGVRPGRAEITVRWETSRAVVGVTVLKGEPQPIACLSIIPKDGCL